MDERLQSRVIDYLRFPMAVLVVLCHCKTFFGIGGGPAPAGQSIQVFLAEVLPHIAVPVFVFFSGFLFFYKTDFCLKVYAEKIRRRTKSLLLPYLIWCAFGYVLAALQGQCSWTVRNFLFGFWDTTAWMELPSHIHAAFPADMPLWFVRDLIIVTLLAPAIHWCIKHTGILLPAATGIWWFSHWYANIPGLGSQIVFFFILGAWFSINRWNFVEKTRNLRLPLWIVAGGLMVADFIVLNNRFQASGELQYCWPLFNAYVLFGVFAVIQLVSALLEGNVRKASRFWTTGSFFLYAVHFLYSPNLMVAMGNIWYPSTAGGHLLFYLAFCSLTIGLAIGIYYILYRFAPKITSALVGGRLISIKMIIFGNMKHISKLILLGISMITISCENSTNNALEAVFIDSVTDALANGGQINPENLQWTREPQAFEMKDGVIEITTAPHTDLWQRTYYHFRNDNAPVLQMKTREQYFSFVVKTDFTQSHHRFDQCGIVMYLDSDNWLKGSVEFENEEFQHLGSVVTNNGYSDWATTAIPADVKTMWYRFSRRADDYCIECSTDGINFSQMRICHMYGGADEISFGIYACSPEESSFTAIFSDMKITECMWKAHDGQQPDE